MKSAWKPNILAEQCVSHNKRISVDALSIFSNPTLIHKEPPG